MKKYIYFGITVLYLFVGNMQVSAQTDPHFTQNYMYPMAVNPALTGTMDGSYRVSSIYRNQWANIANPFSTIGISAEVTTSKNISIGANFFRETAGNSGYQYSAANISLAYGGVRFGKTGDQQINFGLQGGFVGAKFSADGFQFGQQWVPGAGYVAGVGSGENIESLSSSVPDLSFGVTYLDRSINKSVFPFGGISVYHLTQPKYSFLRNSNNNRLPMRFSAQAGAKIILNDGVFIVPNIIYNQQQKASEIIAATYAQFYVNESVDFMLGGNVRINDSVSPFIGLYINGITAGLSYDVNTSSLRTNAPNSNAFELSISFSGGKQKAQNPAYFNCPRF